MSLNTYIYRKLKAIDGKLGLAGDCSNTLNNLVLVYLKKIVSYTNVLLETTERKTLAIRDMENAVRLLLNGTDFGNELIKKAHSSVEKYRKRDEVKKEGADDQSKSRSKSAGLIFPVTRIETAMSKLSTAERKSEASAVFLASVLENIMDRILTSAGEITKKNSKVRITCRYLKLACLQDNVINKTVNQNVLLSGGVLNQYQK